MFAFYLLNVITLKLFNFRCTVPFFSFSFLFYYIIMTKTLRVGLLLAWSY